VRRHSSAGEVAGRGQDRNGRRRWWGEGEQSKVRSGRGSDAGQEPTVPPGRAEEVTERVATRGRSHARESTSFAGNPSSVIHRRSAQAALVEDELPPDEDDELLEDPVDDVEEDDVDDSEVEDFEAVAGDVEDASGDDFAPLGLLPLVRLSFR
jgi:hypothetical protein